jgi:hypothetical protein
MSSERPVDGDLAMGMFQITKEEKWSVGESPYAFTYSDGRTSDSDGKAATKSYDNLEMRGGLPKPALTDITAALSRFQAIWDDENAPWMIARKLAYPSIGDQLDMQYHDGVDRTTTWADAIAAVKAKFPKP